MDSEFQPEHPSIHEEQTIEVAVSGTDSDDSDSEESAIGSPTPFKLRAPQPRAVTLIPSVHVESAGTPSPEPSPRYPVDRSLLSPPEHRRFTSRPRTPKPRRPASAPPTIVTFDNQVTCFVENWEQEPQEETRRSSLQDLRPGDLIRPTPLLCKYIPLHDFPVTSAYGLQFVQQRFGENFLGLVFAVLLTPPRLTSFDVQPLLRLACRSTNQFTTNQLSVLNLESALSSSHLIFLSERDASSFHAMLCPFPCYWPTYRSTRP